MNLHDVFYSAMISGGGSDIADLNDVEERLSVLESSFLANARIISRSEFNALTEKNGIYLVYDDIS